MPEKMKLLFRKFVVIFSLLILASCSDDNSTKPTSDTFTQTINANQENLVDYDEIMLSFETGTVSQSFDLEINKLEDVENISFANYEVIGDVYEIIHDENIIFNNSVNISFDYDGDIDPSNFFIGRYLNGEWTKLFTSYNDENERLSAMTDQLCWFALFWGENPSFGDVFIPAENSTVSGDVLVDICLTDNVMVSQVNFGISSLSLNHQELGVDITPTDNDHFSIVFDSSEFEDGQYTLRATAYDDSEVIVSVTWPIIIDNSGSGSTFVANPYFTPNPGYYTEAQLVTINCSSSEVDLRYTLDGSEPNQETSQIYTSPLMISESTTIKAKGFKIDYQPSETVVAYYEIDSSSQSDETIFVPAGSFTMGDTSEGIHAEELPTHEVTLSPFYMSKYEQTYGKVIEFLNSVEISPLGYYHTTHIIDLDNELGAIEYSDGTFYFEANEYVSSEECPVIELNYFGAILFSNWLSEQEGLTPCYEINMWTCDMAANGYRLPTEAEWEYAARGASADPDYIYSGSADINSVAWYDGNNDPYGTKEVASKTPNSLGLYDMSGNVNEWCNDSYGAYSDQAQINPTGADSGFTYVVRGGAWNSGADECRVSYRVEKGPFMTPGNIGFRLVRNAE